MEERQLALGPEGSRHLHVTSFILIRITQNPGASHPLSAQNITSGSERRGRASEAGQGQMVAGG